MKNLMRLTYQLSKTYNHYCAEVMKKHHITKCELDILLFLHNNPELNTAKDIVEKRCIVKSHASMGIDQLMKKGYLKTVRDQKDRRKYHLYLLEDSKPIVEDGLKMQQTFNNQLFQHISKDDKQKLWDILEQIYMNIKEDE